MVRLKKKQKLNKMYDVAIIGAGIAGLTAAIYAGRAGKSVIVFESNVVGGQIIESLSVRNWPGDSDISGMDLMKRVEKQARDFGAKFEYAEISKVEKTDKGWKLISEDGDFEATNIIIATGTVPRRMSEEQTKDAGDRPISYCATCDGALYKDKPVVVVGHGNTAKYEIKYLENICSKVYQIHHDDPIPADAKAVFVAIGRVPATKAFKGLVEMNSEGYIVAGEDCKTSAPGIYVAGDCRTKKVNQLVTAAADGAIAASMI